MKVVRLLFMFFKQFIIQPIIIGLIVLFSLEICYRYQIIDFYASELKQLNSKEELSKTNVDLLVFGDSFGAGKNNYIEQLKNKNPDLVIINSSVVGFGVIETNIIAQKRIKRFNPKKIAYQIYEGNDLLDVQNPIDWRHYSFLKNVFWKTSNHIRFLGFLNFRLKVFNRNQRISSGVELQGDYAIRTKIFLDGNPNYIQDITEINPPFDKAKKRWDGYFHRFINRAKVQTENIAIYAIPHCTQVGNDYLEIYNRLNENFKEHNLDCPSNFSLEIAGYCQKQGVEFIPLCNSLIRSENKNKNNYYAFDPHFNENGQTLLADQLEAFVNK